MQFDYAPDYKYYQSDVTRVFPANGRFTPRQREFYTDLPAALSGGDDVDHACTRRPQDILRTAVTKMDAIMAAFTFTDPKIKDAATAFVESYRAAAQRARQPRALRRHGGARRQRGRARRRSSRG